jgi:hypothetical protein
MKFAIAGLATTVFALVAVATAPSSAASPDQEFLDALASSGMSVPAKANPQVVNQGHLVCRRFADGNSYSDAVASVAGGLGGNRGLAGAFVRAATTTLCPKYTAELP